MRCELFVYLQKPQNGVKLKDVCLKLSVDVSASSHIISGIIYCLPVIKGKYFPSEQNKTNPVGKYLPIMTTEQYIVPYTFFII